MVLITDVAIPGTKIEEEHVAFEGSLKVREYFFKLLLDSIYDLGLLGTETSKFKFYCITTRTADCHLMDIYVQNVVGGSFVVKISNNSNIIKSDATTCYLTEDKSSFEFLNKAEKSFNYVKTFTFTQSSQSVGFLNTTTLDIPVKIISDIDIGTDTVSESVELKHSFGNLIHDEALSDCTMESNDGNTFKLHKAILSVQSSVLNNILKSINKVFLDDVNKDEMESLIEFTYTDSIQSIANKDCINLLRLSHVYDLPGLKILAENALVTKVDSVNAIEMLCVAELYSSEMLEDTALKCLTTNTNVLESDSWKLLKDKCSTKALFQSYCRKILS